MATITNRQSLWELSLVIVSTVISLLKVGSQASLSLGEISGQATGRYGMEIVGSEGIFSLRGDVANRLMVYPYPVLVPSNPDQEWEAIDLDQTPFSSGNELAIRDLIDAMPKTIENRSPPPKTLSPHLEMILGAYESQLSGQGESPSQLRKP